MPCGATSACSCTLGCPLPSGVSNPLGFKGVSCCKTACPAFPLHHVVVCIRINDATCLRVQTGCACPDGAVEPCPPVNYNWGVTENSWGKKCRVVQFNRHLPADSFVRFRFCACDSCTSCGDEVTDSGLSITNSLLTFKIDGTSYLPYLTLLLPSNDHVADCSQVTCFDVSTDSCCVADDITLTNIPLGTEIRVGPIGSLSTPVPRA